MIKQRKFIAIILLIITISLATIPSTIYAYNSDYLSNASWLDNKSTINKTIKNDNLDCTIHYLIENNTLYVQLYAKQNNISNKSYCEIYADSNGESYNFRINNAGLATENSDIKKRFSVGANFSTSDNIKVGKYVFAIESKTKATNKFSIFLWIDNEKYEIIDNIVMHNISTTSAKSTTNKATEGSSIYEAQEEATTTPAIITEEIEKAEKSKEESTKFKAKKIYTTKKKNSKKAKEATTKYVPEAIPADFEPQLRPHKEKEEISISSDKNTPILLIGISVGVIGLVLMGFCIARLTQKTPAKKEEKNLEEVDDFEF